LAVPEIRHGTVRWQGENWLNWFDILKKFLTAGSVQHELSTGT
jgi:hypothetical protein